MKTDKNKVYDKAEPKKEETGILSKANINALLLFIVGPIFVTCGILACIIPGKKPKPNVTATKKVIKKKVNKGKLMCKTQENKIEKIWVQVVIKEILLSFQEVQIKIIYLIALWYITVGDIFIMLIM